VRRSRLQTLVPDANVRRLFCAGGFRTVAENVPLVNARAGPRRPGLGQVRDGTAVPPPVKPSLTEMNRSMCCTTTAATRGFRRTDADQFSTRRSGRAIACSESTSPRRSSPAPTSAADWKLSIPRVDRTGPHIQGAPWIRNLATSRFFCRISPSCCSRRSAFSTARRRSSRRVRTTRGPASERGACWPAFGRTRFRFRNPADRPEVPTGAGADSDSPLSTAIEPPSARRSGLEERFAWSNERPDSPDARADPRAARRRPTGEHREPCAPLCRLPPSPRQYVRWQDRIQISSRGRVPFSGQQTRQDRGAAGSPNQSSRTCSREPYPARPAVRMRRLHLIVRTGPAGPSDNESLAHEEPRHPLREFEVRTSCACIA